MKDTIKEVVSRMIHDPEIQRAAAVATPGNGAGYYVSFVMGLLVSLVSIFYFTIQGIRVYRKMQDESKARRLK